MVREGKPEKQYRQQIEALTAVLLDRDDVARHDVPGEEYFHRPAEVLVRLDRLDDLRGDLRRLGADVGDVDDEIGIVTCRLPDRSVHDSVRELQKVARDPAAVAAHHVLFGVPHFRGCPGRPPFRGAALTLASDGKDGSGVVIAVIDTGQAEQSMQIDWVRDHVDVGPDDVDLLDVDGDQTLDFEAGHGTFVAGVIAQVAPGAKVLARKALDTSGVTDDLAVARAVSRALRDGAQVINLSLGGYAMDDAPPMATAAVVGRKDRHEGAVFVAAAGNDAVDRPFYPAAHPDVIAVAALGSNHRRAGFSNFGPWVDASADGERLLSTFVVGTVQTDSDGDGRPDEFAEPFAHWSGTSFAAPQVSAAIAVRMSARGESAAEAAFALVGDPALARRTGLGVQIRTPVRSHPASVAVP